MRDVDVMQKLVDAESVPLAMRLAITFHDAGYTSDGFLALRQSDAFKKTTAFRCIQDPTWNQVWGKMRDLEIFLKPTKKQLKIAKNC